MVVKPFLILIRPANVVTAIADILAGLSVAGLLIPGFGEASFLLILATIGLYGGGIVFNDIFDFELDRIERPERILPSGQLSLGQAKLYGSLLLVAGITAAFFVNPISGGIAILIALLALLYDKYSKHYTFLGPLNMGLCRSFNLLLGISISTAALAIYWPLAFIPLIFIFDITLTSQGEVKGNNRSSLYLALLLDLLVFGLLIATYFFQNSILPAVLFLFFWLAMNGSAKWKAIQENTPANVMNAVKMGVLSLIPLNASIAAGFGGWLAGLIILLLLPVSLAMAKYFSVT